MRIIFMGTPNFARDILDALLLAPEHDVIAVYCQPPRAGGRRGRELVPSAVQVRAEGSGIPVFTPTSLRKAEAQAAFSALDADVAVVAAYGLILPQTILNAPTHGCLNVHGSLLPRWRGAAPVQRAILAGDAETGVGIMQMEAGLDTGPVRLEGRTPVAGKTTGNLTRELAAMGGRLMVQVLGDLDAYPARPQPEDGVTYAAKIDKAEARIDFSVEAVEVERLVRAMNPAPGAWFEVAGERVKVLACEICDIIRAVTTHHPSEHGNLSLVGHSPTDLGPDFRGDDGVMDHGVVLDSQLTIACRDGAIRPSLVQRAGRGVTSTEELLRGFSIPAGTRL